MNTLLAIALLCAWPQFPDEGNRRTAWPEFPTTEVAAEEEEKSTSVEEEFAKPPPLVAPAASPVWQIGEDGKLIRLPGPRVPWPHEGCGMCLAIHLERTHRVTKDYLETFRGQWDVIHCNFHNEHRPKPPPPATPPPTISDVKTREGGCRGGACSSPSRSRWRGLFR